MNILSRLQKIRACESEVAAQLVLENTIQEAVDEALAERDEEERPIYMSHEETQKIQNEYNLNMSQILNSIRHNK